jgi:hypothetical protein
MTVRTILFFAEHFWKVATTRSRGPYSPRHSPLRYRVTHGRHTLRVRAIGPTGLRGPAAIMHFRVLAPRS